ncbi:MAG: sulfatase [Spirochaetota bacterium]
MAASARPNILWICSDQQRFDTLGVTGNELIRTPNLDRLASEGTVFNRAYSQAPICTPSRASFLTGMYASTVHACTNGNERWAEAAPLLPAMLRDGAGYDCGLSGKLHLAGAQGRVEPRPADDGYRFFRWSHHPIDDWDEGHDYADWIRSQGMDPARIYEENGFYPAEIHQTTWCTDEAIRFIDEERDGPWLMSINYFDPHPAFDPPASHRSRYDPAAMPGPHYRESDLAAQALLEGVDFQSPPRDPDEFDAKTLQAAYYAMIELIDENVGRLLDHLERTGARENTIIVYTSDHGESLGDHGLLLKGCRFYEGLVRVPLIVAGPGFAAGQRSDALVELTDIAPTLLEVAGMEPPERFVGRSLAPMLRGEATLDRHRDHVRSEYYHTLSRKAPGRDEFNGSYATMIRDDRYKLVVYHGHPVGELFDLEADPWEHENLWDDPAHAEVRFRLLKQSFDDTAFAVDLGPGQTRYY